MPFSFGFSDDEGSSSSEAVSSGSRINTDIGKTTSTITGTADRTGTSSLAGTSESRATSTLAGTSDLAVTSNVGTTSTIAGESTLAGESITTGISDLSNFSEEEINSLNNIITTLSGSGSGSVLKGTEQSNALLANLGVLIPTVFGEFTREQAIADSSGAVTASINQILNLGLPDLRTSQTSSGAFDDTTTELLRNDLVARAAAAGASIQQEAINTNAQIQLSAVDRLLDVIRAQQEGTVITATEEATETVGEEATTGTVSATGGESVISRETGLTTEGLTSLETGVTTETGITTEVGATTEVGDITETGVTTATEEQEERETTREQEATRTDRLVEESFEAGSLGRERESGSGFNFGFTTGGSSN